MPDDFEQRLGNALRAEASGLPFVVTVRMVEERLSRAAGLPRLGVLASAAGALLLIVAIALGLGRGPLGVGVQSQSPSASPFACPVTRPNGVEPPLGELPSNSFYGNPQLVTTLWPGGVIKAKPDDIYADGSAGIKWGWWRGAGVKAWLTAGGHRLDQSAPPLRIDIPAGYGLTGFQVAGIYFPTPGCWEVTARAGDATLTFVALVTFPAVTGPGISPSSSPAACNVTRPIPPFAAPSPFPAAPPPLNADEAWSPNAAKAWYGSDALWTRLNRDGEVWHHLGQATGHIDQKMFWWSKDWGPRAEPEPAITVILTRLDGDGSYSFGPGTNATSDDLGGTAMLVGVTFPGPVGCWQLTAHYRGAALSFVVWIKND